MFLLFSLCLCGMSVRVSYVWVCWFAFVLFLFHYMFCLRSVVDTLTLLVIIIFCCVCLFVSVRVLFVLLFYLCLMVLFFVFVLFVWYVCVCFFC